LKLAPRFQNFDTINRVLALPQGASSTVPDKFQEEFSRLTLETIKVKMEKFRWFCILGWKFYKFPCGWKIFHGNPTISFKVSGKPLENSNNYF